MTREEKNQFIDSLTEQLNDSKYFYFTDIADLNSEATTNLRRLCFKKDVKLQMVKNTLLQKAMEKTDKDLEPLYEVLKGSTSIMFAEAGNVPAKLIKEFRKKGKLEKPLLKGAFVEEISYIGEDQLDVLVNIKSKNELIADVIALLQSPAKNVISALQSSGQTLTGVLKTLSEKAE
jgi:large subunit ribosomal protein L10